MKIITPEIIQTLINDFSHGAGTDYNPCSQMGSQRESFADLGYGWVYFAMARAFDARSALVIGSGRGYSAACIGLALDAKEDSQIVLVDPGYTGWDVDGKTTDHADGLWRAGDGALSHFRDKLDIHNISLQPLRSDEAFEGFIRLRRRFDLIVIDGDHGYAQSLRDLKNGLEVLTDNGIIIAHDAYCPEWAGVAAAIESLVLEDPSLDRITIPNRPGLAIIQRRPSTICYRIATVPENEIINGWRRQADLAIRPLSLTGLYPGEDDPQPGVRYENPNVGLFSVYEKDELIGGFGIRYKTFSKEGPDDFLPDDDTAATGYLCYGSVLRPDKRGRRRWMRINCMLLRQLGTEGFYTITRYTEHSSLGPYTVTRVGANPPYAVFYYQLKTIERVKSNERVFRRQLEDSEKGRQERPVETAGRGGVVRRPFAYSKTAEELAAALAEVREQFSLCQAQLERILVESRSITFDQSELTETRTVLRSIYASKKWRLIMGMAAPVLWLKAVFSKLGLRLGRGRLKNRS